MALFSTIKISTGGLLLEYQKQHIWLHGPTIAQWFTQQKSKCSIGLDEGYCLKCKAVVKLINPEPVQHGKFHLLRAPCPTCMCMVYRGVKHDQSR